MIAQITFKRICIITLKFLAVLPFMGFMATLAVAAPAVTDGLVGYWPLNGNAIDASGNGHNGTINGAVETAGKFDKAYSFNGNASIQVGDIKFPQQTYTINGWIRTTEAAQTSVWRAWISKLNPNTGGPFEVSIADGRSQYGGDGVFFLEWDGGATTIMAWDGSVNLRDGKWHMYTVTHAPGAQKFYVDGKLVTTTAYNVPMIDNSEPISIGGSQFGGYHFPWKGDVDEVAIYNRAVSDAEVIQLYSGPAIKAKVTVFPGSGETVAGESFDFSVLIKEIPKGLSLASYTIKINGFDFSKHIKSRGIQGQLVSGGEFIKLNDLQLPAGKFVVTVAVKLSDGTVVNQTANWTAESIKIKRHRSPALDFISKN